MLSTFTFVTLFLAMNTVNAIQTHTFPTVTYFTRNNLDDDGNRDFQLKQTCRGALIARNIILTSATCQGMIDVVILSLLAYPYDIMDNQ